MTIALGFTCADGIIVASDSQMSSGDKFKRYDEPKVFHVPYTIPIPQRLSLDEDPPTIPAHGIAVAISGSLAGANYFREILNRRVRNIPGVRSAQDIVSEIEQAAKDTRERIIWAVGTEESLKADRAAQLDALDFAAIVAFTLFRRDYIYTIWLWNCLAVKSHRDFETIGCGEDIASLILTDSNTRVMTYDKALALAVFAIEMAKRFDQRCGGKVQHRAIIKSSAPYPISFSDYTIEKYSMAAQSAHSSMIQHLVREMNNIVQKDEPKKAEEAIDGDD